MGTFWSNRIHHALKLGIDPNDTKLFVHWIRLGCTLVHTELHTADTHSSLSIKLLQQVETLPSLG